GLAIALGVPAGLLAAQRGGNVDWVLGRVADAMLSIPAIIAAIVIVAVRGPSLVNAMTAVGLSYAPRLFRVARGAAIDVGSEPFIECAVGTGSRPSRIMFV